MSEEVIERVDQMIRKNNVKYKDEQSQRAYEQALKQYEKQTKTQLAKQYAELVKEGNRKAIEKAKAAKKVQKKPKKKVAVNPQPIEQQKKVEPPKKRMSQAEVNVATKTIEARAERIIQQQQLEKLNKKLQAEKKRTKLYELNQKCKKMLSKSHERINSAKNISEEKMLILKKLQDKAVGEIGELDNIINNLIDQANHKAPKESHIPIHQKPTLKQEEEELQYDDSNSSQPNEQQYQIQDDYDFEEKLQEMNNLDIIDTNFLNLNTLIFQKSSQELLSMDYIPL